MKTKEITLIALLTALTIVILYLNLLLPISTLSILTLASVLIPVALIRSSVKGALFVYIASSIIGIFILPINIILLYVLFFGVYGIIKYYIEKLNKLTLEILLKLTFFNIDLAISFFVFRVFIVVETTTHPLWILWFIAQPAFLIFDYALTLIIGYYLQKIHNRI